MKKSRIFKRGVYIPYSGHLRFLHHHKLISIISLASWNSRVYFNLFLNSIAAADTVIYYLHGYLELIFVNFVLGVNVSKKRPPNAYVPNIPSKATACLYT